MRELICLSVCRYECGCERLYRFCYMLYVVCFCDHVKIQSALMFVIAKMRPGAQWSLAF